MQQVSLIGKIKNVNFDFNAIYSSTNSDKNENEDSSNQLQLLNEKSCCSSTSSSSSSSAAEASPSKFDRSELLTVNQKQQQKKKKEEMPSHRRKVRNVEQRRKMKRHNRRDDIPDCETLEIIEFDENCTDPSIAEIDSDLSSGKGCKKSSSNSFKAQLVDPETRVSLTDTNNNDNYKYSNDSSFKSGPTSSASGASSSAAACSKSGAKSSSMSTEARRRRKHKSKSRRHEKPSPVMKFAKKLLENLGQAITDFFMFLCSLLKIDAGNRTTPAGCLLLLVGTYFFISYIEVSFAGMVEILFEWLWPSVHISLRMIERFFKGIGNAFAGLDDLAESSYCDMASMWCDFFNLMCSSRCSFTKFALERIRG